MAYTHTTGVTYRTAAGQLASSTDALSADTEVGVDDSVAGTTTNKHYVLGVDVSEVQSFAMYSDKAVTVKTNSPSAPDQTIELAAGKMLTWNANRTDSNPLTTDITDLYVTNAGGTAAQISFRFLLNQP